MTGRRAKILWLMGLCTCLAGCGGTSASECIPGEALACTCDDGLPGGMHCDDQGRFGACSCMPPPEVATVTGALGTHCSADSTQETWLVITPDAPSCTDDAVFVGDEGPGALAGAGDGIALRVSSRVTGTGRGSFATTARRCTDGVCEEYPAEVTFDRYVQDDGGSGRYAIALPDGSTETARFQTRWCAWDRWAPPIERAQLAAGLRVDDIAIYQGVKVPLVEAGALVPVRNAAVIAGRPARLRIGLTADAQWTPRSVRVRLTLRQPGGTEQHFEQVTGAIPMRQEAQLDTTFNFELAPDDIAEGTEFYIELLETDACIDAPGDDAGARWPARGRDTFDAEQTGALEVTVVPVTYLADGSGRAVMLDDALIERMRAQLHAYFPVSEVILRVRDAVGYTGPIDPNCDGGAPCGWEQLVGAMIELRIDDGAPPEQHYFGLVQPGNNITSYCGASCIVGLAAQTGAQDEMLRAGTGVGWTETEDDVVRLLDTMVHELGHTHGRGHSPCGDVGGLDPDYPYAGGLIGSWGYDIRDGSSYAPDAHPDIMGYCDDPWLSDYTYAGLATRLRRLVEDDGGALSAARAQQPQALVVGAGTGSPTRRHVRGRSLAGGEPADALDAFGRVVARTQVRAVHLPDTGGTLWLTPEPEPNWARLKLPDGTWMELGNARQGSQLVPLDR